MRAALALALVAATAQADPCARLYADAENSDDPAVARPLIVQWNRCLERTSAPRAPLDPALLVEPTEGYFVPGHGCAQIREGRRQAAAEHQTDRAERWLELEQAECAPLAAGGGRRWRLDGARACFAHDRATALEALRHLGPLDGRFLIYVCSRNNISLE